MQPDIVYQSPQTAHSKNKIKLNLKSFTIILPVLGVVLVTVYLTNSNINLRNLLKKPAPAKITSVAQKLTIADFRKSLVKDIQSSFASSKDAAVMGYIDLAGLEDDAEKSYQYYKKAFEKMVASYTETGLWQSSEDSARERIRQKIAMIELKAYASGLPNYKESDFILPK